MRGRDNSDPATDRWQRKDWWGITLEAPDPHALLEFWSAILDKPIWDETETGGSLDLLEGVASLGVQKAEVYQPPVWPPEPGRPGMQLHLEVQVTDLAVAVEHAIELGATLADHQPQDDVRVLLDPAGHPFCLYT
jgi:hypothetical protein